jgi:ATP-binding cassette subfamily B (MDR/TAP) protein 1
MKFFFNFIWIFFVVKEKFDGQIQLNNVEFRYPNRSEVQVLKDFSLTIEPRNEIFWFEQKKTDVRYLDKQIALVGASGCGKSTIIQLLEHFYNLTSGQLVNWNKW